MYSDDFIDDLATDGAVIGYAVKLEFPSETLHIHTGVGDVVIDGTTYIGVGELGSVNSIENVSDANPASVEIGLMGIPSTVYNSILTTNIRGSSVTLYKVIYSNTGYVLNAAQIVVGQVTAYSFEFGTEGSFSLEVADEFNLYERPLQKYYTQSSWLNEHAGDNFWQYVSQLSNRKIFWGAEPDGTNYD